MQIYIYIYYQTLFKGLISEPINSIRVSVFYESEQCSREGARFQKMTLVKTDTSADHVSKTHHFRMYFLQYVENPMFLIGQKREKHNTFDR